MLEFAGGGRCGMSVCYGCKERHIWYDEDGKAHSCHEKCKKHADDKNRMEEVKKKKAEIQMLEIFALDSLRRATKKRK
jgi:hypothetical protein